MQDGSIDAENLILQVSQLKKANTNLKKDLKRERKENERLRKMINPNGKSHYRNARKKGSYGMRG